MISQLLSQLGVRVSTLLKADQALLLDLEQSGFNVFHVAEAQGSPYVPTQEEFVIPYGIKSAGIRGPVSDRGPVCGDSVLQGACSAGERRSFQGAIPDHVYFKDRESRFVRVSQAQALHLGVSAAAQTWEKPISTSSARNTRGRRLRMSGLKKIPVVVLTTSEAAEDVELANGAHANCYITKPMELEQFLRVVQSIESFWLSLAKLPLH